MDQPQAAVVHSNWCIASEFSIPVLEAMSKVIYRIEASIDAPKLKHLAQQSPQDISSWIERTARISIYSELGPDGERLKCFVLPPEVTVLEFSEFLRDLSVSLKSAEGNSRRETFTVFPNLPQELRDVIWDHAIENAAGPSIVEIWTSSYPQQNYLSEIMPLQSNRTELFHLKQVCKEVNKMVMKSYTANLIPPLCQSGISKPKFKPYPRILLDVKSDIVFLNDHTAHLLAMLYMNKYRNKDKAITASQEDLAKLENVAMRASELWRDPNSCISQRKLLTHVLPQFKSLKRLLVVMNKYDGCAGDDGVHGSPLEFSEYIHENNPACQNFLRFFQEKQKKPFQNLKHLKNVHISFVTATRTNPPKLLSREIRLLCQQVSFPTHPSFETIKSNTKQRKHPYDPSMWDSHSRPWYVNWYSNLTNHENDDTT
jgi:hypothetical protein